MKKVFVTGISLLIVLVSVLSVSAVTDPDDIYYIEELGITVETPYYTAATRVVNNLDISEAEYKEMLDDFEAGDIYYYGYSTSYAWYGHVTELFIYGEETDTRSLSTISDFAMEKTIENQNKGWEDAGVTVSKSEVYESHNAKYILTHFTDEENNYAINYYTVENYKSIDIVMWSYGGEPSASEKQHLVSLINTIEFDESTASEDLENILTFSIAENGKLTPLGEAIITAGVVILINIIAGIVVAIILVKKAKKRRHTALSAQPPQPENKFCIFCGTQLNAKDSFCHKCGKNQNTAENTEN